MSRWPLLLLLSSACAGAAPTPPLDAASPGPAPIAGLTRGEPAREDDGAGVERRAIRTGTLRVAVDAWEPLRDELGQWLGANGGLIGDEDLSRSEGRPSWGRLVVRVPAARLDDLVAWVQSQAEVEHLSIASADVTDRWVDQEARLRSHRAAEERLLGLLADRTGTLADVLAVEAELTRVRAEIEALDASRRALADQVALATLTLDVRVRDPFLPAVAEPLLGQSARAFRGSLAAMGLVARGGVIVGAALAPWLAVGAALLAAAALIGRSAVRRWAVA